MVNIDGDWKRVPRDGAENATSWDEYIERHMDEVLRDVFKKP